MDSCPVSWYGVTFFRRNDGAVPGVLTTGFDWRGGVCEYVATLIVRLYVAAT